MNFCLDLCFIYWDFAFMLTKVKCHNSLAGSNCKYIMIQGHYIEYLLNWSLKYEICLNKGYLR